MNGEEDWVGFPFGITTSIGLSLLDQVVHDGGHAAHGFPGVLVTAAAVEQVQDRILDLLVLDVFVTVRGVHIHTAFETQGRRIVPDHLDIAVPGGALVVLGYLARDDQDAQEPHSVPLDERIGRIGGIDPVDVEVVGPEFGCGRVDGDGPDTVRTAGQGNDQGFSRLHERAVAVVVGVHPGSVETDIDCLGSGDAEGGLAALHLGGHDPGGPGNNADVPAGLGGGGGSSQKGCAQQREEKRRMFHKSTI